MKENTLKMDCLFTLKKSLACETMLEVRFVVRYDGQRSQSFFVA
jgi:hypothetical protein